ncbi:MAG: response regulator transcription factor [Oscillochloris sp.]|nr:response regulator transcription factor [Oscillochloris sp.]
MLDEASAGATLLPHPLRVLLVDSTRAVRAGLRATLARIRELTVVGEAGDGLTALHMVDSLQPDVVLMDAQMPQLDGITVTRQIKIGWPAIRVVVLTLHPIDRAAALAAGADAFLLKGCPREALLGSLCGHEWKG